MRIFCHISEFVDEGYSVLPALLCMTEKVTLWSPPPRQMAAAHERGRSLFSHEHLLEWVRDGHVQILGRKEWLTDPASRVDHPFEFAPWHERFDGEVAKWGLEDLDKADQSQKRVVCACGEWLPLGGTASD